MVGEKKPSRAVADPAANDDMLLQKTAVGSEKRPGRSTSSKIELLGCVELASPKVGMGPVASYRPCEMASPRGPLGGDTTKASPSVVRRHRQADMWFCTSVCPVCPLHIAQKSRISVEGVGWRAGARLTGRGEVDQGTRWERNGKGQSALTTTLPHNVP